MITSIVTKYLLQDSPVLESPIDILLSTSQPPLYLHHIPRVGHTHCTLAILRGLSDISIIRLNSFTRTKRSNQRVPKNSDITILSSQKRTIQPDNIPCDNIESYFYILALTSCSCGRNTFSYTRQSKSLFHRQISDNRFLYHPSTYCLIDSKKNEEN